VGARLVNRTEARTSPYKFNFHLLKDQDTINAFALPGGQIFITRALLNRLESEGQLAGVLGHEIGHVIQRHSAEHMARAGLTQGMVNAASVAIDGQAGQVAAMIGQTINMRYGRDDELESDRSGLRYMFEAGYDPRALIGVMKILDEASGGGPPEFLSSHPKPANRIQHIQ
jgi:predicted Zn-dependent protease